MQGHEPSLTESNHGGWTALCSCGWIGETVQLPASPTPRRAGLPARRELAKGIALDAHTLHCHDVAADVARQSERALRDHGRRIDLANAVLQRRGRFGHS